MKFWNFAEGPEGRELRLDGVIASESWWGDEITPAQFRKELFAGTGQVTVWINSPGGDVVAASQIYTMLVEYRDKCGAVIVKIDGIAASAASVIAMAGSEVLMSPTATMFVHNPWSWAIGDAEEMRKASAQLEAYTECIINAYQIKTGLGRTKLRNLMEDDTVLYPQQAVELGFADGIIEAAADARADASPGCGQGTPAIGEVFSQKAADRRLYNRILASIRADTSAPPDETPEEKPQGIKIGIKIESLNKRLNFLNLQ